MKYGVNKLACRTGVILLRFSGERGQARGEREVRDTRPSHLVCLALRTSRSPRACPRSPEKRKKKITPVLQARNVPRSIMIEVRKCRKKWIDFVKQKRTTCELTRNSSICSKHFTNDDFIRRFWFVDEVSNKPCNHPKTETRLYRCKCVANCPCLSGDHKSS